MFATTPKTDMTDLPRKAPKDAVHELLTTIPGMMLDTTNDAGIAARLENRPGRYDLHLTGGTPDVRSALAEAAAVVAKTTIDLGVETDEVEGELVAMASRLHLTPAPLRIGGSCPLGRYHGLFCGPHRLPPNPRLSEQGQEKCAKQ